MALEIVDAVRESERSAAQTEKSAAQKREEILKKAHADAQSTVETMTRKAQAQADAFLAGAERESGEILKNTGAETKSQIAELRKAAEQKESEAIRFILSDIV